MYYNKSSSLIYGGGLISLGLGLIIRSSILLQVDQPITGGLMSAADYGMFKLNKFALMPKFCVRCS